MNSRVGIGTAALAVTALVTLAACSNDTNDATPPPTNAPAASTSTVPPTVTMPLGDIVATALTNVQFTTLAGLVVDAGLVETLRGAGPFTVFAPVDAAFDKLPLETLRAVQANTTLLTTVLTYHVAAGAITAADLLQIADTTGTLDTVAGIPLTITRDGDTPLVNGFKIALADVKATNGIVHALGDVLVPPAG